MQNDFNLMLALVTAIPDIEGQVALLVRQVTQRFSTTVGKNDAIYIFIEFSIFRQLFCCPVKLFLLIFFFSPTFLQIQGHLTKVMCLKKDVMDSLISLSPPTKEKTPFGTPNFFYFKLLKYTFFAVTYIFFFENS